MRWLKFIFEQYSKDADEPIVINLQAKADNPIPVSVGNLYAIASLYYVVADTDEYPYEVYIASPYWELASHKDLIVDGRERRWAMLSVVRYVTDGVLAQSFKFDEITPEEVRIMKRHIHFAEPLPYRMTGLSYREGDNSFQELFRNREIERSRVLLASMFQSEDQVEEEILSWQK